MECVRVRLLFEDRRMLSQSQKSEGLKRSWLLLKPELQIVSDLSSHLLHCFDLHQSCPHGLLLYMDGFVLPPFESTCIFKDKDVISVKKKRGALSDFIKEGDTIDSIEELETQPLHADMPLLANEDFQKETGGYQSEPEEDEEDKDDHPEGQLYEGNSSGKEDHLGDTLHEENCSGGNAVSRKRKASKKLQSSKKKRQCSELPNGTENDNHTKDIESYHSIEVFPRKSLYQKVSNVKNKTNVKTTKECADRSDNDAEAMPSIKRAQQCEENNKGIEDASQISEGIKKISRSARRKKSKRKWMRAMAEIGKKDASDSSKGLIHWKQETAKREKKDAACHSKGLLHWKQSPEKGSHKNVMEHKQANRRSDAEDDVVPIVVRPGHIRFESLGEDQAVRQSQAPVEITQWNGISSKKKGQKWGKERVSSSRRNDYRKLDKEFTLVSTVQNEIPLGDKEFTQVSTVENEIPLRDISDFDKLPALCGLPKEGDVVAYHLLELSSSWTPELSCFRVGKISFYDPDSGRTMLMPVPEYPIVCGKSDADASHLQTENSLYRDDGSLEIDFSSLVDIRIIKQGNLDPAKVVTGSSSNESPAGNINVIPNMLPGNNNTETEARTAANGAVNPWDQFTEVLNAKKAQLSEENGWSKESTGKSSWSYRALRGSALGPTMAILRSKNEI